MATGNTAYAVATYTAFATEQTIEKKWENLWFRDHPLVTVIKENKSNWGKGAEIRGNKVLCPIVLAAATTVPDGIADASELTGITPAITNDFTSAEYLLAHYIGGVWNRASELRLINNNRGGGFLQGKIDQMMDGFVDEISDDLASGNADSRTAVLGIRQVTATSNTVGGISQSTDTDWASNLETGVGTYSLDVVDSGMNVVKPRKGKTDLILFAYSSSNDLFQKHRNAIQPSQYLVNTAFEAKYGFENVMHRGAMCVSDNRGTAGEIIGLDTRMFGWVGDMKPQRHHDMALPNTDVQELIYNMFCAVYCKNPAKQWRKTGVT